MRSLRRCSLIQPSEEDERYDSLAPTKGILSGILISMVVWACLGIALWRLDNGRGWHAGKLASFVYLVAGGDGDTDRHGDH